MNKVLFRIAAFSGAVCVALGAFGAHGLKQLVSPEMVAAFDTGVRYQFYHTLALLVLALLGERLPSKKIRWAVIFFLSGIVLFSGSLYALTILQATDAAGVNGIGVITPVGGLCFITGWVILTVM